MRQRHAMEAELEALGLALETGEPCARAGREPRSQGAPFAPLPGPGARWPIVASGPEGRCVSFVALDGAKVGRDGRRFKATRGATRWHAGVDLYARAGDPIVACEDGEIVGFIRRFLSSEDGSRYTSAVLVKHPALTVNYGEVAPDSLSSRGLEVGSRVTAGQVIGAAGVNPGGSTMLHFETYRHGLTGNQRWLRSSASPPSHLLDPTPYLLALQERGLGGTTAAPGAAPTPQRLPDREEVRWAQRMLNRISGESLTEDGRMGPLSRAALKRFQERNGLAPTGDLDVPTDVALVQRGMETLRQQSVFGAIGQLDARTREELRAFRAARGLLPGDQVDATTRAAILEALRGAPTAAPRAASSGAAARSGAAPVPTLPARPVPAEPPPTAGPESFRRFRLTSYYVADQQDDPTTGVSVPVFAADGSTLASVSPAFFAKMSLEGTGRLTDERLLNVTGKWRAVDPDVYAPVLAYHRARLPKRPPGYSGLGVEGNRAVRAMTFHVVPQSRRGLGYGVLRGVALRPFRTLAADLGLKPKSEPRYKGKGGLVPALTRVFIREFHGMRLPDGTIHDGWFTVNDTGGGIFGAHFDVFTGTRAQARAVRMPSLANVWFRGIAERIPPGYEYGLSS